MLLTRAMSLHQDPVDDKLFYLKKKPYLSSTSQLGSLTTASPTHSVWLTRKKFIDVARKESQVLLKLRVTQVLFSHSICRVHVRSRLHESVNQNDLALRHQVSSAADRCIIWVNWVWWTTYDTTIVNAVMQPGCFGDDISLRCHLCRAVEFCLAASNDTQWRSSIQVRNCTLSEKSAPRATQLTVKFSLRKARISGSVNWLLQLLSLRSVTFSSVLVRTHVLATASTLHRPRKVSRIVTDNEHFSETEHVSMTSELIELTRVVIHHHFPVDYKLFVCKLCILVIHFNRVSRPGYPDPFGWAFTETVSWRGDRWKYSWSCALRKCFFCTTSVAFIFLCF